MSVFAQADFMNDAGAGRGHGDGEEGALRALYAEGSGGWMKSSPADRLPAGLPRQQRRVSYVAAFL